MADTSLFDAGDHGDTGHWFTNCSCPYLLISDHMKQFVYTMNKVVVMAIFFVFYFLVLLLPFVYKKIIFLTAKQRETSWERPQGDVDPTSPY
jgi:hypothetical protein